ncbi:ABC transporter substrate-binding protein [Cryptosporangium aurantiacum]|uniref:Putative spermidine/putrescine transport system substrate-binding protein n=1 Tax=Cryptosporangium aurantiacum TaxID=134849 RepID=A0A1M7RNC8_9ACTN|nr:ABC transporter substrate-binding protein [Cryptosporangium aurantiacum]SHN47608.1 putative spermidine/putrescine transport system substrate-binding protein [Cryptosporangium aurantiacum]
MRGRVLAAAVVLLVVAGCNSRETTDESESDGGFAPPKLAALTELGTAEGELSVLSWAGYAEDGSNDPEIDWVTPFEEATGCRVSVKVFNTSDEAVTLMETGKYDVVSASGDASLRLIADGAVEPVNTDLVPNYADLYRHLKNQSWNSVDGVAYGIPHGWGANLLMYRSDVVKPAPTSWSAVFAPNLSVVGKVTAYDSPIYLADAALYLMKHQPDLGITNPYALDDTQFAAAIAVLEQQKASISEYWSDYSEEVAAFKAGDAVVGTTWQVIANVAKSEGAPVEAVLPAEGATGWSDTWMVASASKHKTCAYKWFDHIVSPSVNAQVAEYFGEAPSNPKACGFTVDPSHCRTYHAGDAEYAERIWYWSTPISACLDGRTNVRCKDYEDWAQAWTTIKG